MAQAPPILRSRAQVGGGGPGPRPLSQPLGSLRSMAGPDGGLAAQLGLRGVPTETAAPGRPAREALFRLIARCPGRRPAGAGHRGRAVPLRRAVAATGPRAGARAGQRAVPRPGPGRRAPRRAEPRRSRAGPAHRHPPGRGGPRRRWSPIPGPFAAVANHPRHRRAARRDLHRAAPLAPDALDRLAARGRRPAAAVVTSTERFLELTRDGVRRPGPRPRRGRRVVDADAASATSSARSSCTSPAGSRSADDTPARRARRDGTGRTSSMAAPARRRSTGATVTAVAELLVQAPDPEDEVRAARAAPARPRRGGGAAAPDGAPLPGRGAVRAARRRSLDGRGMPWNGPVRRPAGRRDGRAGPERPHRPRRRGLRPRLRRRLARARDRSWTRTDIGSRARSGISLSRAAGVVAGAEPVARPARAPPPTSSTSLAGRRAARRRPPSGAADASSERRTRPRQLQTFIEELLGSGRAAATGHVGGAEHLGPPAARPLSRQRGARADWPERELDAARRVDEVLGELASLDSLGSRGRRGPLPRRAGPGPGRAGPATWGGSGRACSSVRSHAAVGRRLGGRRDRGRHGGQPAAPRARGPVPPRRRPGRGRAGDQRRPTPRGSPPRVPHHAGDRRPRHRLLSPRRPARRADAASLPGGSSRRPRRTLGQPVTAEWLRDDGAPGRGWPCRLVRGRGGAATGRRLRSRSAICAAWSSGAPPTARSATHPLAVGLLGRGYELAAARVLDAFTAYDGNVGEPSGHRTPGRPVSATALQDWAQCPFRYLLASVLRVREVARPEASRPSQRARRGDARPQHPGGVRARCRPPIADRGVDRATTGSGCASSSPAPATTPKPAAITGRPLLWRFARRRIEQTADRFLAVDTALRRQHDAAPAADGLEVPFGLDGAPEVRVSLPDSRPVTFRGRIDRVDRSPDGERVVVYDYKTGRPTRTPTWTTTRSSAASSCSCPSTPSPRWRSTGARLAEAYYWFTAGRTRRGAGPGLPVRGRPAAAVRGGAWRSSSTASTTVASPAVPGDCDYDPWAQRETFSACSPALTTGCAPLDRGTAWDAKSDDPAVDAYWALDPEPVDGEGS